MQRSNVTVAGSNAFKLKNMVCLLSRNRYAPRSHHVTSFIWLLFQKTPIKSLSVDKLTRNINFVFSIIKSISVKCLKRHFALREKCMNLSSMPSGFLLGGDQQIRYSGGVTSPTWLGKPDEDEHMKMSEVETCVD